MNYAPVGRSIRVAEDCEISQGRRVDVELSAVINEVACELDG